MRRPLAPPVDPARPPPWSGGPAPGFYLLVVCLVVLAACYGGGDGGTGSPDELVVAAAEDLSPSGAFQARLGVYPLNTNVGETLTRLSSEFRVEPFLATRWDYQGENRWRFHLRTGIRFHDGTPLDAAAVAWSMDEVARGGFGYSGLVEGATVAVDDSTVDITTAEPNLRLPEQLVHPNYSIFAPGTDPTRNPVGTGPFRFVEYRPDERFVVERWDGYWGALPHLRRITFRFFADATTRVLSLFSGEVDLVMDLPRQHTRPVSEHAGLAVSRAEVGQMMNLHPNLHGLPPHDLLHDAAIRRALARAVDRETMVRAIWEGEGSVVQNMTAPAILAPYADRVHGISFDAEAASSFLEQHGWVAGSDGIRRKDGRALRLELVSNPEVDRSTTEFIQAAFRGIGVDLVLVRLPDSGSYNERLNRGQFDLNLSVPNQNDGNPLFLPALIFDSRSGRPFSRWHAVGPEFDRLVEAGLSAPDPADARRFAAEAIHLALDEEAALISLAGRWRLYGVSDRVEGFVPHPAQTHQSWAEVRLAR